MVINIQEVKEKIITYLNEKGPSLPIPVAKSLSLQTMLVSAVLSELINEKKVKTSNLVIGNSPLYLIPGQEAKLEPFSDNLHGVEKEAYNQLNENKILIDEDLEPAIRVALRHIKDYAFSFQHEGKTIWRYFLVPEFDAKSMFVNNRIPAEKILSDVSEHVAKKPELQPIVGIRDVSQSLWNDIEKQQYRDDIREKMGKMAEEIAEKQRELDRVRQEILDKAAYSETRKVLVMPEREKIEKKGKKPDKKKVWLEEVKGFILKQNMELLSVEGLSKDEVVAKVRSNADPEKSFLLIAIDKKKIAETDITRAYKKSLKLKLPYYLAAKGELSKKVKEKVDSFKALMGIGNLVQ